MERHPMFMWSEGFLLLRWLSYSNLYQILADSFAELDRLFLKFIQKFKGPRRAKIIKKKKKKVGGLRFLNVKTYGKQH